MKDTTLLRNVDRNGSLEVEYSFEEVENMVNWDLKSDMRLNEEIH